MKRERNFSALRPQLFTILALLTAAASVESCNMDTQSTRDPSSTTSAAPTSPIAGTRTPKSPVSQAGWGPTVTNAADYSSNIEPGSIVALWSAGIGLINHSTTYTVTYTDLNGNVSASQPATVIGTSTDQVNMILPPLPPQTMAWTADIQINTSEQFRCEDDTNPGSCMPCDPLQPLAANGVVLPLPTPCPEIIIGGEFFDVTFHVEDIAPAIFTADQSGTGLPSGYVTYTYADDVQPAPLFLSAGTVLPPVDPKATNVSLSVWATGAWPIFPYGPQTPDPYATAHTFQGDFDINVEYLANDPRNPGTQQINLDITSLAQSGLLTTPATFDLVVDSGLPFAEVGGTVTLSLPQFSGAKGPCGPAPDCVAPLGGCSGGLYPIYSWGPPQLDNNKCPIGCGTPILQSCYGGSFGGGTSSSSGGTSSGGGG